MKKQIATGSALGLVAALLTGVEATRNASPAAAAVIKQDYFYTGTEQTWTVPKSGVVKLITVGGGGSGFWQVGSGRGGDGAVITSWHAVTAGQKWTIRVGGGASGFSAGGSATAVVVQGSGAPISVAGGGGGGTIGGDGGSGGFGDGHAYGPNGGRGEDGDTAASGGSGGQVYVENDQIVGQGGQAGDPDGGAGGTYLDLSGEDGDLSDNDISGGGGGGTNGLEGGDGGDAIAPGPPPGTFSWGGESSKFTRQLGGRSGGGGAGFGGGGGGAIGGGGGGYSGGGGGSTSSVMLGGGGGAGGSFARTTDLPAGGIEPQYSTGPQTQDGTAYGEGGASSDETHELPEPFEGQDGLVKIEFEADPTPPTPPKPTPKPVATPGKPAAFKVGGKATSKKRKFAWRASKNANKSTRYILEIRARGSKKVLLRKTTASRSVTYKRTSLIKKARKYQKRSKTIKFNAKVHAKTGAKYSKAASKNFNVRR